MKRVIKRGIERVIEDGLLKKYTQDGYKEIKGTKEKFPDKPLGGEPDGLLDGDKEKAKNK